ncbi:MAG: type II TA system antitoxin MqsA family protein [Myxococcota bacterium]
MKCHKCGKADLVKDIEIFEYGQANLPYKVMLVGVPVKRCPACRERVVTIPDPDGLHRALCLHMVEGSRTLHPAEIRFLRKYLDKSAEEWAAVMGVDKKTLSRWENGRQKMGPVAERLLRLLVHQQLRPDAGSFSEEMFPKLRDERGGPPASVKLASSPRGWRQAA